MCAKGYFTHSTPHFPVGHLYITACALADLNQSDVAEALKRHQHADWGECCPEDWQSNEDALQVGARLFSVYTDRNGIRFWIITEADRSVTTILLPSDY